MRLALVSLALLATSVADAATPINGWYSSVFGGYAYVPNNISVTNSGLNRTNSGYQGGYDAGGSLGYKSNPMRYEGELTYLKANLQEFNVNGIPQTGVNGYSNAFLAMANVYYDFDNLVGSLQPYLGLGIGYGWVQAKLRSTGPVGNTQLTASNTEFAYQGIAGLTYNFSESYALSLSYRYIATTHADDFGKNFQANLANLGAVYRFDGTNYK